MRDELWVDGQIDGTAAFVIFRRYPFTVTLHRIAVNSFATSMGLLVRQAQTQGTADLWHATLPRTAHSWQLPANQRE